MRLLFWPVFIILLTCQEGGLHAQRTVSFLEDTTWRQISLVGERMKPGYPFEPSRKAKFPWHIPAGAAAGAGATAFLLLKNGDKTVDCDFTAMAQTTGSTCNLSNGSATITVSPADFYTYAWSTGESAPSIQAVQAGTYGVTITRSGTNCTRTLPVIIENSEPVFDATITASPAHCGVSDGSVTVSVNPTGSYTFKWSTGMTGQHVSNLATGTYMLTVSAGGTCTKTYSVPVGELPPEFNINISPTPARCKASDGSATAQVIPQGDYTYLWSNGSTSQVLTGVAAGEYTLTVTINGTACQKTSRVIIGESPPDFTISITTSPSRCGIPDGGAKAEVSPPGEYHFLWPDGSKLMETSTLAPGDHQLTVTNRDGCVSSATFSILENPPDYIYEIKSVPGNCIGQGTDIILITHVNTSGPLEINASGPEGTHLATGPSGILHLNTSFNILPGAWQLSIHDINLDARCTQVLAVDVLDSTILKTRADSFQTTLNMPLTGNVLENDQGTYLSLTKIDSGPGGTFTYSPDGNFSFTPEQDFTGDASFIYTIRDTCGTTANALIYILVEEVVCDFTVKFVNTNASCGLANGISKVIVDSPGTYLYNWNTGQTGPVLDLIKTGKYSVSIEETSQGCSLAFETEVFDEPAKFISNIQVFQPTCSSNGDIRFELSSTGGRTYEMEVSYPPGTFVFQVPAGTASLNLSTFLAITIGNYTIKIRDKATGTACTDSFTATIAGSSSPIIQTGKITPPSQPSSMNGSVVINLTKPGRVPYTVRVNNADIGITTQTTFTIAGLGAATYTIQVRDANGCLSNMLVVTVPFTGPAALLAGIGLTSHRVSQHSIWEQPISRNKNEWNIFAFTGVQYSTFGFIQETSAFLFPQKDGTRIQISQLGRLFQYDRLGFIFSAGSGFSITLMSDGPEWIPNWMIFAGVEKTFKKTTISARAEWNNPFSGRGAGQSLPPGTLAGAKIRTVAGLLFSLTVKRSFPAGLLKVFKKEMTASGTLQD